MSQSQGFAPSIVLAVNIYFFGPLIMVGCAALQLIPGSLISAFGNSRVVTQGGRAEKGTGQDPGSAVLHPHSGNSLEFPGSKPPGI